MAGLSAWELGLFAFAVYLSLVALVRLMRGRRDQVVSDLRRQVQLERQRQKERKRRERQRRRRGQRREQRESAAARDASSRIQSGPP